jgi:cupin 2 domain-containing protein
MNIYDLSELPIENELFSIIEEKDNIRIERIVSTGHTSKWYDQQETEFVLLLQGHAEIEYKNGLIKKLDKGDNIIINPHEKHRVVYTTTDPPCIWLCVFYN